MVLPARCRKQLGSSRTRQACCLRGASNITHRLRPVCTLTALQTPPPPALPSFSRLAAPLGVCSVVGVGGLALNGGWSLLSRAHGATADNILEATLVLADGSVVSRTALLVTKRSGCCTAALVALGLGPHSQLQQFTVARNQASCCFLARVETAKHAHFNNMTQHKPNSAGACNPGQRPRAAVGA